MLESYGPLCSGLVSFVGLANVAPPFNRITG